MNDIIKRQAGFSLIELVIVIVISGILATVGMRFLGGVTESVQTEQTKQELDALAEAMVGVSSLTNVHSRADFGYVGDVGAFPPNLDALMANPGGFSTWKGPYIGNRFEQTSNDYKTDAWGATYLYTGGVTITSTGSGSNIVRQIGTATSDFLANTVTGVTLDADGSAPGTNYADSVTVVIRYPNGSGGMSAVSIHPDIGGYFQFSGIPIGNQAIFVVYEPTADTLEQFVSVTPKSSPHVPFRFSSNLWLYTPTYLISGLVGHWKLDDGSGTTAEDASGYGNHGTLINMNPTTDWVAGKIVGALDFDGTNDCVNIGNSLSHIANFTVSAWANPASAAVDRQIVSKGNNGSNTQWELKTSTAAGHVDFRAWLSGPGASGVRTRQPLPVGTWTHLVGTYDGSLWRIYWNGVLDSTSNMPGPVTTTNNIYIGAVDINGSPGQFWHGQIDDVRIYNRVLTDTEIQSLYLLGGGI